MRMERSHAVHLAGPVCWTLCCVHSWVKAMLHKKKTLMRLDSGGRGPLSRFWSAGEQNQYQNTGVWHCHEGMCQGCSRVQAGWRGGMSGWDEFQDLGVSQQNAGMWINLCFSASPANDFNVVIAHCKCPPPQLAVKTEHLRHWPSGIVTLSLSEWSVPIGVHLTQLVIQGAQSLLWNMHLRAGLMGGDD